MITVLRDEDTWLIRLDTRAAFIDPETLKQIEWCMWRIRHGPANGLTEACAATYQDQLNTRTQIE